MKKTSGSWEPARHEPNVNERWERRLREPRERMEIMMKSIPAFLTGSVLCLCACLCPGVVVADDGSRCLTAEEAAQVQVLQERMLGDAEIIAQIQALADDPEMQALLSDQSVLDAVASGDISALTRNPRFMRIMENARVKDIRNRLSR